MATKVRFKLTQVLWVSTILCCGVLVHCRPNNGVNSFIDQTTDPSDKTLIRVLRSEFEEDEKEQASLRQKAKVSKVKDRAPRIKKRASEEDQFFQALLSRANDKPVEKRSYESQPEKDDVRMNWKGDSKISDADKHELEHLFNTIGVVDNEEKKLKGKVDAKRATKIGMDSKVQELVEWLMAKPPKEFHDSLRHIIDVEHEVSNIFASGDQSATSSTSDVVMNDPMTTTTETTSPVTTTTATNSSPVSVSAPPVTSSNVAPQSQVTSYTSAPAQPVMSQAAPSTITTAPSQTQIPVKNNGKKPNLYADVMEASKIMAQTGPGPIPSEAMDYFNKFPGGVGALTQQHLSGYGVHPEEVMPRPALPAVQHAPVVSQHDTSAVAANPQQHPQAGYSTQAGYGTQAQAGYGPQAQAGYGNQAQPGYSPQPQANYGSQSQANYANQYQKDYNQHNRQRASPYPRVRNGGYNPPPPPPYPLNRLQLDKSTGKKKTVTASLLFKQNWSPDLNGKHSTRARVFGTEVRRELRRAFELKKNFKKIIIDKISEDRGKVDVTFTVEFRKETKKPLQPLYEQIIRDYLGTMPVYRDTLFRGDTTRPKAPKRTSTKMAKSQSENPATEFAQFADQVDRELTGENLPLNERHEAYQGCFKDKKPNRDMKKHFSKFEMTPEWCLHTCKKEGYRFAGVQYSYLCFCGNKFGKYGRVHDTECSSRCYGDRNRFCGSFWHNSVYSIDGQHHDPDEFTAVPDDEDPDEVEANDDDDKKVSNKEEDKEHAEVANHLMKAASSALKAAKKLLPGKNKRQTEAELIENTKVAQTALKAVDDIVHDEKNVHKRSAENSDGRSLLMAYLGDVGGYDREYRSAEDENKPVEKLKFDYKRMIIDEEGDGEFMTKPRSKEPQLKRSRRSLEPEEFDGRKKMASRAVDDGSDVTNPMTAVAEPSRRGIAI